MEKLTFGHLNSCTVRSAVECIRAIGGGVSGAVVRSLDSARTNEQLLKILSFHKISADIFENNVWLTYDNLVLALAADVFTGFDEIWVYKKSMPSIPLRDAPSVTSDGEDFSVALPVGLAEVIEQSDCALVVGDGCGLNYAGHDHEIIRRLRLHCASE